MPIADLSKRSKMDIVAMFTIGVAIGSKNVEDTITWGLAMAVSVFILSPAVERFYDKYINN
jgi:flagellar biosynthesis protein FliP